jgi:CBS domain containing-hemolysin-like protein
MDLLEALAGGKGEQPVTILLRKLLMVDSAFPCDELLNLLRKSTAQIAMVTDQKRIVGLVTLEDVLAELVGEFADEKDSTLPITPARS